MPRSLSPSGHIPSMSCRRSDSVCELCVAIHWLSHRLYMGRARDGPQGFSFGLVVILCLSVSCCSVLGSYQPVSGIAVCWGVDVC